MEHPKDFAKGLSIGIIMDGNGRWAKSRGLPRTAGHKKGAQVFQDIANYCDELGVESVYFYAFSTENWKRPAEEVGAIMRLFGEYLIKGFDYENRNVRICFMGDRTVLEPKLQELMNKLERDSACKTGLTINIAINYGGRPEIVRAAQRLAARAAAGELKPEDITEDALSAQMYTAGRRTPTSSSAPVERSGSPTSCSGRRPIRSWWKWTSCGPISPAATSTPPSRSSTGAPAVSAACKAFHTQMPRSLRGPRRASGISSGADAAASAAAGERLPDETKENMKL